MSEIDAKSLQRKARALIGDMNIPDDAFESDLLVEWVKAVTDALCSLGSPASEGGKVEPFCRYCAGYAVAAGERHHSYTCNRPRHQEKPAKVRMTEELETVLAVAEQAEVHFRTGFTMLSPRSLSDIRVAIAAVRAQAAEAGKERLPMVRKFLERKGWSCEQAQARLDALSELDAHEKGEGRG